MRLYIAVWLTSLVGSVVSQQIWDIVRLLVSFQGHIVVAYIYVQWQTTWDRQKLFTRQPTTSGLPINFGTPGAIGSADIVVDDTQIFQSMDGFGATLSEQTVSSFLSSTLGASRVLFQE
jgi:hypothetical protein